MSQQLKITDPTLSEVLFNVMESEMHIKNEIQASVHKILNNTGLIVKEVKVDITDYIDEHGDHYPTVKNVDFIIDFKNPVQ